MPRRVVEDVRFGFRGGVNTTDVEDDLGRDELRDATNARIFTFGGVTRRTGSQKLHGTALASAAVVRGVFEWDASGTKQLVAVAGGNLHYKTLAATTFTTVAVTAADQFSTTAPAFFQTFRADSSGANLLLFIGSSNKYYKWDGATVTRIDGVTSAPTTRVIKSYATRMFATHASFKKKVYWSQIGDAEDFTVSNPTDGGNALVDVLTGDEITAMETIGGSLLLCTDDSISRFTGYSADDIQIAQDTRGISNEVGPVGPQAIFNCENLAYFLSDKGPYVANEAGVVAIGQKVADTFEDMDRTVIANAVVGYHRGRYEVWYAFAGASDSALNKRVMVYQTRIQKWYGPFVYPFGITSLARYEDANGDEWLIAGCSDGFVRHLDTGGTDDIGVSSTAGSVYTMTVEFPPIWFTTPTTEKALTETRVQADLESGHALAIQYAFDGGALTSTAVSGNSTGNILDYRTFTSARGKRLRAILSDASSTTVPIISGVVFRAFDYRRPS